MQRCYPIHRSRSPRFRDNARATINPLGPAIARQPSPRIPAECNACQIRSARIGVDTNRTPVASRIALANAGATGLYGASLIDFAPNGLSRSEVLANSTSVAGTSAQVGI